MATLDQAARVLAQLYDSTPEGFVVGTPGADRLRDVGRQLDAMGGFEMMRTAHTAFAAARPRMARNLEMVWDGIGSWRG